MHPIWKEILIYWLIIIALAAKIKYELDNFLLITY